MKPSKVSANRYALLDELRGLDLISMMCYHGLWDVVFLFGVSAAMVWQLAGRTVAAIHLLGVHPAVRFLPAHGTSPVQARCTGLWGWGTGHGGDGAFHAGGCRSVWGAHAAGLGYDHHGSAGKVAGKGAAGGGRCGQLFLFCISPTMQPMAISVLAIGSSHRRAFCTRTSLPPTSGFTRRGSSPPITSRWCPGCFCSGQASSCIT